jgi:hypothetical protein
MREGITETRAYLQATSHSVHVPTSSAEGSPLSILGLPRVSNVPYLYRCLSVESGRLGEGRTPLR